MKLPSRVLSRRTCSRACREKSRARPGKRARPRCTGRTSLRRAPRRHVEERRPRFEATCEQQEALATRFFAAAEEGDLQGLEELPAHDVVFRGDGGGKAPAAARAVHGRARVARLLIAGLRSLARFGGFTTRREQVNG